MSEEDAPYFGERQDALDPTVGLRIEKGRAVSECPLDDGLPPGAMEEGGFGASGDELVPSLEIDGLQFPYPHGARRRCAHVYGYTTRHNTPPSPFLLVSKYAVSGARPPRDDARGTHRGTRTDPLPAPSGYSRTSPARSWISFGIARLRKREISSAARRCPALVQ